MLTYSSSWVRSSSSASARTIFGASATAHLLGDRGRVLGLDAEAVDVVDGHHGRPGTRAETLRRPQRHLPVLRRRPWGDAELGLERVEHLLRAPEAAADVRAHLDQVPAHRCE